MGINTILNYDCYLYIIAYSEGYHDGGYYCCRIGDSTYMVTSFNLHYKKAQLNQEIEFTTLLLPLDPYGETHLFEIGKAKLKSLKTTQSTPIESFGLEFVTYHHATPKQVEVVYTLKPAKGIIDDSMFYYEFGQEIFG